MPDHPDIDELFAADEPDDGEPDDADVDDVDIDVDLDGDQPSDEAVDDGDADEAADDGDDDLVALVEAVVARAAAPPEPEVEPEPESDPDPAAPVAAPATTSDNADAADDGATGGAGLVLQFPSPDFPPPPVFRLRVPPGWLAVPVPDALMAVRRPDPVDGFFPNVLVRARRVPAASDPGAVLAELAAAETVPDGMEPLGEGVALDGATPARWLQLRFDGPDGRRLQARHLLVYVPATARVAHVLSVVGTWPDGAADEFGHEVAGVVGSLRLFRPDPTG